MEPHTPSATRASRPLEPGARLDRYELLCVLAHGGMATVWLARLVGKHGFEKLVAIKTMLPVHAEDEGFRRMFLDEARIASRIEHPNVVQILDLGEQDGVLYIVMELVDGDPLQKLVRAVLKENARMPLGITLRVIADACAGLDAAHRLLGPDGRPFGVVHRDVSPQNILVTTSGIAKVIDFGIAKARERSVADTADGTFKGKIQYMPREQALGKEIDRRADVWSIGAVLYALCAGRPPYKEESQFATLQLLMNWAPIPALPPHVPAPIAALAMKALAHDPNRRFQTAAEMQAALDEAMVRCNMTTTSAHVAAFVAEHLAARIESRRQAIDVALREANARARAQSALMVGVPSTMPPPATLRGPGRSDGAGSSRPPSAPRPPSLPPREGPAPFAPRVGGVARAARMTVGGIGPIPPPPGMPVYGEPTGAVGGGVAASPPAVLPPVAARAAAAEAAVGSGVPVASGAPSTPRLDPAPSTPGVPTVTTAPRFGPRGTVAMPASPLHAGAFPTERTPGPSHLTSGAFESAPIDADEATFLRPRRSQVALAVGVGIAAFVSLIAVAGVTHSRKGEGPPPAAQIATQIPATTPPSTVPGAMATAPPTAIAVPPAPATAMPPATAATAMPPATTTTTATTAPTTTTTPTTTAAATQVPADAPRPRVGAVAPVDAARAGAPRTETKPAAPRPPAATTATKKGDEDLGF